LFLVRHGDTETQSHGDTEVYRHSDEGGICFWFTNNKTQRHRDAETQRFTVIPTKEESVFGLRIIRHGGPETQRHREKETQRHGDREPKRHRGLQSFRRRRNLFLVYEQ